MPLTASQGIARGISEGRAVLGGVELSPVNAADLVARFEGGARERGSQSHQPLAIPPDVRGGLLSYIFEAGRATPEAVFWRFAQREGYGTVEDYVDGSGEPAVTTRSSIGMLNNVAGLGDGKRTAPSPAPGGLALTSL